MDMSLILRYALLFALSVFTGTAAEFSPEQAALNHYAGDWDGTLTNFPGAKVHITCKWILDGAFLQHSITIEQPLGKMPISSLELMTYDTAKQKYRGWVFYSNGLTVDYEGSWDAASSTFTWTYHDEISGINSVTKVLFSDADSESAVNQTKNRDGDLLSEIRGTRTRRK